MSVTTPPSVAPKNLESLIQAAGSAITLLRNSASGPNVYPVVPPEYTNWRDEQRAWQETCVLFNQSYHMSDMYVSGPQAKQLLQDLGTNSFENFPINVAKQYAPCTEDGYVVGDVILMHLPNGGFNMIGRPSVLNWVQFHCETKGYDAKCERDERSAVRANPLDRKTFRFQIQGPNAFKLMTKVIGKEPPQLKFFHMGEIEIAGCKVGALRHGMAGQPGYELFGQVKDGETVRQAFIAAGEEFGLRLVGARAYSSNTLESGWVPSPMPAIYSGANLKSYREWLPADSYEAKASLGGSFVSNNIEDYYFTPYDLGYGVMVKFDHDFIGRAALEKFAKNPRRQKVTLELNNEDVIKAIGSQFSADRAKYFDFPSAVYSALPYDAVLKNGVNIGLSTWIGYSSNERKMLTLAMLDVEHAVPGNEVTFVWGEPNGGTKKPTVESHKQVEIRAMVCPAPYAQVARTSYAPVGWRHQ